MSLSTVLGFSRWTRDQRKASSNLFRLGEWSVAKETHPLQVASTLLFSRPPMGLRVL